MTVGIVCIVVLGLIALYQTWAARTYREAALLFQQALESTKVREEKARRRLEVAADAMTRAHRAAIAHDVEGLIAALRDAAAVATAVGDEPAPVARGER